MRRGQGFLIVLGVVMFATLFQGIAASNEALSAFHQIYAALWYLMAVVCLVGMGVIRMMVPSDTEATDTQRTEDILDLDNPIAGGAEVDTPLARTAMVIRRQHRGDITQRRLREELLNRGFRDSEVDAFFDDQKT